MKSEKEDAKERGSNKRLPVEVLGPLCERFRSQADTLLDLWAMTQEPGHPGTCVKCFYRLLGTARQEESEVLDPLRSWIEAHIEIEVTVDRDEAGRLPVRLEAEDLEDFCHEAIRYIREDTAIGAPSVELEFCYREERRAG